MVTLFEEKFMDKEEQMKIVEEMQKVVDQMKQDDIDDNPASADEYFVCTCCGEEKPVAGSVMYGDGVVLCNDCVLLAEVGLALGKIKDVQGILDSMEDVRLEKMCEFIKHDQKTHEN